MTSPRWDQRYLTRGPAGAGSVGVAAVFAPYAREFPESGSALDVACGQGGTAVWLARRGLSVWGLDISGVAIDQAGDLAARCGVADRCRFSVADLDSGLPAGGPAEVIVCQRFRAPHLYPVLAQRLAPGGLLAIEVLSEVDAEPGPYRAPAGELRAAFGDLGVIAEGERAGIAWLLARK